MCDINHRATLGLNIQGVQRPLGHKHVVGIFGLPEDIGQTAIKRIGVISPLMVERMPQAASEMLFRGFPQNVIFGARIGRRCIVCRLHQHGGLSPATFYPAGRVV